MPHILLHRRFSSALSISRRTPAMPVATPFLPVRTTCAMNSSRTMAIILALRPPPDFLLLLPAAADTNPAQSYSFDQVIHLSEQVTSKRHPAVFNLVPADAKQFPLVVTDSGDHTILFYRVKTQSGELPLALVVKGTTEE